MRSIHGLHHRNLALKDEGLEHIQFDDYRINDDDDDYIPDMPVQNTDIIMSFDIHELPEHALDTMDTDEDRRQRKCPKRTMQAQECQT
jgi:hypothetical protein